MVRCDITNWQEWGRGDTQTRFHILPQPLASHRTSLAAFLVCEMGIGTWKAMERLKLNTSYKGHKWDGQHVATQQVLVAIVIVTTAVVNHCDIINCA